MKRLPAISIWFLSLLLILAARADAMASQSFWSSIIENHGTVMLLIETESGRIVRANRAAARFYGYSQSELQHMSINDINTLSPDQVARERAAAAAEQRNYFIFKHRLKDGSERTVEVHAYPIDESGSLLYSVVHDITAKIETETALRDQNHRLNRAEMMSRIGHFEFNLDSGEGIFSPSAMDIIGLPNEKLTLEAVRELILPEDRNRRDTALRNLIYRNEPYDVQFRLKRPSDGQILHIRSMAEYDAERRTVFGTFMDVTAQNLMIKELQRQRSTLTIVGLFVLASGAIGVAILLHLLILHRNSELKLKESTAALQEQERRLRHIMDRLPGVVYRCLNDRHWTMQFMSKGAEALFGYSAEDLINSNKISYNELILPEYRTYLWESWQEAIKNKIPLTAEYRIRTASGEIRWVWEQGSAIFDQEGNLRFLEGLIIDITALKETEEALRRREQDLEITLHSIGDAVITTDVNGAITRMNPVAAKMTGWSPEEAIGKPLTDVFRIINSQTREPAANPVAKVLETGLVVGLANHTSLIARDGTEYFIADSAAPISDDSGRTLGVILVFHDVTQTYLANEALARSEKQYRELFDNSIEAVALHRIVLDEEGKPVDYVFLKANDAFETHTGLSTATVSGKRVTEVLPEVGLTDLIATYGRVVLTGEPASFEVHVPIMNKSFQVRAYAVGEDQFVTLFEDITERKRQEETLRESEYRFRQLVELAPDAIFVQTEGTFSYVNRAAVKLFGATDESQLIGQPVIDRFDRRFRELMAPSIERRTSERTGVPRLEETCFRLDGTPVTVEVSAVPTQYQHKDGALVYVRDISERKKAELELQYLSFHDVVTGLYNRRFLDGELHRLDSEEHLPISMIMADVNGLKIVNDSLGHHQGDQLLKQVAHILKQWCREEDIVCRWGGDEFVILLPHTSEDQVQSICANIEKACEELGESQVGISLAIGYATKNTADQDIQSILKEAEDRMYQRKMNITASSKNVLVASLQRALGAKSHETESHCRRLQELALALSKKKGLSHAEQDEVSLLALLHDIGKVGITEAILNKPGPLTSEEIEIIRKHPDIGYRIAAASPDLVSVANLILSHHERWDGKGYPRGLKGDDIPLAARIVTLVDAFEAMTSDRPYRKAMSTDAAIQEILANSGTQFDPQLVDLFVEMMEQREAAATHEGSDQ